MTGVDRTGGAVAPGSPTAGATRRAAALRPLDIAYGVPLGRDPAAPPLTAGPTRLPIDAIEDVLGPALARPPCVISFSGGRDSSALLATAARLARRTGLDPPIPATLRFPGDAATDEEAWQAAVLGHLGLDDWVRIDVYDQLDAVGPVAATALRRHGLLWPFNAHFHLPIIELAPGGTVVTGFGGDEIGRAGAAARAERIVARQRRPHLRETVPVVGLALAPRPVRAAVVWTRFGGGPPWLTPRGTRLARSAYAIDEAAVPFGWDRKLTEWIWRRRYFRVCTASFELLGEPTDTTVVHPFVAPGVLASLATAGGMVGFGGRDGLMAALFADVLPPEILFRQTKATFTHPLWTNQARTFAREWSGGGIGRDLVDPDALRAHWLSNDRDLLSTTLLQAAWLHDHGGAAAPSAVGPPVRAAGPPLDAAARSIAAVRARLDAAARVDRSRGPAPGLSRPAGAARRGARPSPRR